jgi:2-polyprenyl-3-methyl-5-hydroxy-6-metoxy-1,4-benzoquinol methylase
MGAEHCSETNSKANYAVCLLEWCLTSEQNAKELCRDLFTIYKEGFVLPPLAIRQLEPELMDDPNLDCAEHKRALRGLTRIHKLTGTTSRLWKKIRGQLGNQRKIVVADVGCGDALMLRELYKIASARGIELELHGFDFSERALQMASEAAARASIPITTHHFDVTLHELPMQADVIICSLFLHHFTAEDVVSILSKFRLATRQLLLVEDLLRSQLGYALCRVGVQALSRSPIVHVDGPLSVRAAFTIPEMSELVRRAGLENAIIAKHWPERFLLQWTPKPSAQNV